MTTSFRRATNASNEPAAGDRPACDARRGVRCRRARQEHRVRRFDVDDRKVRQARGDVFALVVVADAHGREGRTR